MKNIYERVRDIKYIVRGNNIRLNDIIEGEEKEKKVKEVF